MKAPRIFFITASALAAGFMADGQPPETISGKVLSPYFYVKSEDPATDQLPLKSTSVQVHIAGVIAGVTISQVYKNEGRHVLEAVYTFPASTRAAVYAMEMTVGQRRITARIAEKEQARKDYEAAKKEGRRASLLEQQRPNVFTMNVANILPGDMITVTLKYTELLVPAGGEYRFVFPTVVGPRYSNMPETAAHAGTGNFVSTPYQRENEAPLYDFGIRVNLSAGMPLQEIACLSHKVQVAYAGLDKAKITLDTSESLGGNRDFVLAYRLAGEQIQTGLMLYEHGDEKFFLLMVQPPKRVAVDNIPPREYIFINDVSGSMSGYPMDVSKKIMRNLVGNLRADDRFNVLVFAGSSGWMSDASLPVSPDNIARAVQFIDYQQGGGGTELLPALQKALTFPRLYEEVSRSFVIVTDGYVDVEKLAFDLVRNHAGDANTFVFGIGSSVNRYLIEGLAHAGMGEPFIVLNESETGEKARQFREYITSPVLSRVKKEFDGFDAYDVQPVSLPDVFAERPVILFGKYRGDPHGHIRVRGYAGRKRWEAKIDITRSRPDANNVPLRYLWARNKIRELDDCSRFDRRAPAKDEVRVLGLKYSLLTNYTSFVAIEEVKAADGQYVTVKQPVPLPLHVSNAAVGFDMEIEEGQADIDEPVGSREEIRVLTVLMVEQEEAILQYIGQHMLPGLDRCVGTDHEDLQVEIEVDENGMVSRMKWVGNHPVDTSCLEKIIREWDFSKLNVHRSWKCHLSF